MKNFIKFITFSLLILSVASCVYFPQDIKLNPKVNIKASEEGNYSQVSIVVLDKRDDKIVIGHRGNGFDIASINNKEDLEKKIENMVFDTLKSKHFIVQSQGGKIMEIALLNLKYKSLFGFFTVGSKIDCVLEVFVKNQSSEIIYKNIYRANMEKRHLLFAPFAFTNEKNINLAFEEVINKMLNDNQLIKSLK